jgi:hypothetical protein
MAIISTSEPTLANLVVTYPSTLKVYASPLLIPLSFGAGTVAITEDRGIMHSSITNNKALRIMPKAMLCTFLTVFG